ncbi:DUF885 domain-containing protein [Kordiimonas lacus]|uniref:Uncharacterized conserved protein, DUF885 familyt n=1 Tax=Kordiimonas lacus TaxID=637679 RepID=A0A1G6VUU2_9PROT|nr:DUF885 domain-containing protein [Kordiimonas lacus]SDD57402.1 Uncharacterized conserved protein, DUF885 familyt [Kordiimonas lacus]
MFRNTVSSVALLLALAACEPAKDTKTAKEGQATEQVQDVNAQITAFFDEAMKARLALNPLMAERLGDRSNNDKWPELTDAAADEQLQLIKDQLATLKTFNFDSLNEKNQLSYRIFEITAERTIANDRWRDYGYPVNQMFGWQTGIPSHLMTVHRVTSVDDAKAYIKRLNGVEALMGQLVASLEKRAGMGIQAPKFVYPYVIEASENLLKGAPFDDSGEDSVLLADFRKKVAGLELPEAEADALVAEASAALLAGVKPGYEALIAELKKLEATATTDDGAWKFPDGDAFYAQALKNMTTTDMTADEVHNVGLENVERIHTAMREIMDKVGFEGTLQEFFEFTRSGPQFYYPNTEEGKEEYLQQARDLIDGMRAKVPEYFTLTPKAPMEVRAVEKFREDSAGKAFYNRAAPDGSRPGIFYANLRDMSFMPIYQLEALAYHEGIPGHHFQISISQELEGVPLFQRVARFTAFTEGWGLYTEELGKDMGFYEDPYSDFGRLAMELWRACRLVVDTGIHSKKWTREQAIDYLSENTPNPKGDVVAAIERYIVMPGQATAYMVGKLKIMELRQKAMDELGEKFSYAGFHQVVLENGAVPLSILEENVDSWIKSLKS